MCRSLLYFNDFLSIMKKIIIFNETDQNTFQKTIIKLITANDCYDKNICKNN